MISAEDSGNEMGATITIEAEIAGVKLLSLTSHNDRRGGVTELFRREWLPEFVPLQSNYVRSEAGVLRGVHVHLVHSDYLVVLEGSALIGLKDLRPDSPSYFNATVVEMSGDELSGILIPPGVAHGFYFGQGGSHIYSVDQYWNPSDELGCHWQDPDLKIPWNISAATVSERDALLPGLNELLREIKIVRGSE